MPQIKVWDGNDLTGEWQFTRKIDGVRAFLHPTQALSRADKPLHNLNKFLPYNGVRDVEVYLGSWVNTIHAVRSHSQVEIKPEHIYELDPVDPRLLIKTWDCPDAGFIKWHMQDEIKKGYEGLVLRQGDFWLKVKPIQTFDVVVTGTIPGKGRHEGRIGALITNMGNVGTGLTDLERSEHFVGKTIEVECMELTPDGYFRHPRYIRQRPDKDL